MPILQMNKLKLEEANSTQSRIHNHQYLGPSKPSLPSKPPAVSWELLAFQHLSHVGAQLLHFRVTLESRYRVC